MTLTREREERGKEQLRTDFAQSIPRAGYNQINQALIATRAEEE
jgi:hypothetical protein